MSNYYFLIKKGQDTIIKLHKQIYNKKIILKALQKAEISNTDISEEENYFLLKVPFSKEEECLEFLNYLVYFHRSA